MIAPIVYNDKSQGAIIFSDSLNRKTLFVIA